MKKTIITAAIIVSAVIAIAQTQVWIYQSDGTRYSHNYNTFDSLSRVAPGTLALSQSERTVPCEGETFSLAIFASQPWTATASDPSRIQLSKMSGSGNDTISVKVSANKTSEKVYDTVTLQLADGTTNTLNLQTEAWKDALSITPFSKLFPPAGGAFKIGVSSNTTWTVSTSEPWVTLDKQSGTLTDSIAVSVAPSDNAKITQSIITIATPEGVTLHCVVTREGTK